MTLKKCRTPISAFAGLTPQLEHSFSLAKRLQRLREPQLSQLSDASTCILLGGDLRVMGGMAIDANFGQLIHFRSRIPLESRASPCWISTEQAKLGRSCTRIRAACSRRGDSSLAFFGGVDAVFEQEQKEDAPRNSRSAPRMHLARATGRERTSIVSPRACLRLHFATSAMLVMHDASLASSSVALPALVKREDSRSLVWQQETPNYPPESTPPPHEDPKPKKKSGSKQVFICSEVHCGKQFPRSFALRRHMRIHTGTKPYACDYEGCTQRFNTSGNLSRHKRIHSGERPYPCIFESCGKRFNTSTKLKRHMRIHFPEGQNLFRCIGQASCTWSCDNYKEFAQHQKLHHNVIVGAQQTDLAYSRQQQEHAAISSVEIASEKDNDYFSTADTTREYSTDHIPYGNHHVAPTGSFLYPNSFDKPKSSVLAPPPSRNKLMGPPAFFGTSDLGTLPTMLPKESKKSDLDHLYGSDQRRMKPSSAFPSVQYSSTGGSFSISSDSTFNRPSFTTNSSHFAPLRHEEERSDSYDDQQSQQHQMLPPPGHHVLRPPPQSSEDGKYGGFAVPPPMNPAAPEFTGEELNVVLQLMNENY